MLPSFKKLVAGAAVCLSLTGSVVADDCSNGMWAGPLGVGKGESKAPSFCATKWKDGIAINGIEAWTDDKTIKGVQFSYSDGTNSGIIGKTYGTSQKVSWDTSVDRVNDFRLYGNGKGTALGHIYLSTQGGKTLDVGKNTDGQDVFTPDIAAGYILGAYGNADDNIEMMGLLFLKSKVKTIQIMDVQYPDTPDELNKKKQGLSNVALEKGHWENDTKNSSRYVFKNSFTKSTSTTYTYTNTWKVGVSEAVEVSGELFGIGGKSTTTLSFEYTRTEAHETKTQHDTNFEWSAWLDVGPGSEVYCQAQAMMGTYDATYTSTMKLTLEDGDSWSFSDKGHFSTTDFGEASSKCQDTPFPPIDNIPSDITKREIKFIA